MGTSPSKTRPSKSAAPKAPADVVAAIQNATEEELGALNGRIGELQRELDALRQARKVLDLKLHGKPPSARASNGRSNAGTLADRVYDCITKNGPGTLRAIALKLDVSEQAVRVAVSKSDWFERTDDGKVTIAILGRK